MFFVIFLGFDMFGLSKEEFWVGSTLVFLRFKRNAESKIERLRTKTNVNFHR